MNPTSKTLSLEKKTEKNIHIPNLFTRKDDNDKTTTEVGVAT